MVVQGLNPAKNQGYFIMYGDKVQFQRSYHGTMAVTKRVAGAEEINAEVIFEGDEVKYKTKTEKLLNLNIHSLLVTETHKTLSVHMQQLYLKMKVEITLKS